MGGTTFNLEGELLWAPILIDNYRFKVVNVWCVGVGYPTQAEISQKLNLISGTESSLIERTTIPQFVILNKCGTYTPALATPTLAFF
jgi:hypothetical protein